MNCSLQDILVLIRYIRKSCLRLGLYNDGVKFCRSYHSCQVVGKYNQSASLKLIPMVEEPFSRVLVDCVGRFLKTRSGNSDLLTILCVCHQIPWGYFFSQYQSLYCNQSSNNILHTCVTAQAHSIYQYAKLHILADWHLCSFRFT